MPRDLVNQELPEGMLLRMEQVEVLLAQVRESLAAQGILLAERDVQLAERDVQLAERDVQLAERDAQIATLNEKIAVLEERLKRDSTNSNLPSSSDGPGKSKGVTRRGRLTGKSKRKRGGQKSHTGAHRSLLALDTVDKLIPCLPESCGRCGHELLDQVSDDPRRFQLVDIVDCRRHTTEWQLLTSVCRRCGAHSRAAYDAEVMPRFAFGPGVVAAVALMTGQYRLSRRNAKSLLHDHFDIDASLGSIIAIERRASTALAPAHQEIHERIKAAAVLYTDATTWARSGVLKSIVVIASTELTAFFIREDGSTKNLVPLFDPNSAILVSDRASVFGFWLMHLRQVCWAHVIRKFVSFAQRDGPAGKFGKDLLTMAALVFDYWHAFLDGKLDRARLQAWMQPIQVAVSEMLHKVVDAEIKRMSGSCKNLLAHVDALWTFVSHEGVEPTNNNSERELRPFVLWRRSSFGSQSEAGDRFAERIMSVVHSARKLGRSARDYVVEAVRAQFEGRPAPTLLDQLA